MAWASRGFRVFSLDHQGHGLSEDWAERSAFARFEDLVDDYIQFMHQRRAADPALAALPCYLYGHSMGSLVALRVAQREPSLLTGLMISGCPLSPAPELASPAVQKICLALSRYLAHFPIKRLELHDVCRYQPTLDSIDRDPLCNTGFIAARWGAEMLNAIEYTRRDLKRIVTPSVAVNGTVDKLTAIEGSRIFVREAMQSPGRRLYQFEGAYHDLLGDPECFDDVMAILFDFVHTTSKGALGVQADPKVLDARLERSCLPSTTS
jgi:alpha-beta hydrolase superfamily lysophospholipase